MSPDHRPEHRNALVTISAVGAVIAAVLVLAVLALTFTGIQERFPGRSVETDGALIRVGGLISPAPGTPPRPGPGPACVAVETETLATSPREVLAENWRMITPDGRHLHPDEDTTDAELFTALEAGKERTGRMCFVTEVIPGQYQVVHHPVGGDRHTWAFEVHPG